MPEPYELPACEQEPQDLESVRKTLDSNYYKNYVQGSRRTWKDQEQKDVLL